MSVGLASPPPRDLWVVADDGARLHVRHWPRVGGVPTLLLPGRAEPAAKYDEVADRLRSRGCAVWAPDWRGQGASAREAPPLRTTDGATRLVPGWIRDFDRYVADLGCVVAELALRRPLVVGHSMGGHLALRYALSVGGEGLRGVIATAPMVALNLPAPRWQITVATAALVGAGLGHRLLPGSGDSPTVRLGPGHSPFEGNDLTYDQARFERYQALLRANPDLATGPATLQWLQAALRSMALLRRAAPRLRVPALLLGAVDDALVPEPSVRAFAARMPTARYVPVPGAKHELYQERDAAQAHVWRAVDWSLREWAVRAAPRGERPPQT